MNGKHWPYTLSGLLFSQCATPLGLAIPIYTATGIGAAGICGMPILNPANSGVNLELVSVDIGYGSGTADYGAVGLMAGFCSGIGTATGCSALAATIPMNGNLGVNGGSRTISSNSGATTTVTAGTAAPPVNGVAGAGWVRTIMDINLEAVTGTAHGTGVHSYDFNGTVCVPPGMIVYIAATKASVALYASCIIWKEILVQRF